MKDLNINQEHLETIERYLNGGMNRQELERFKDRLETESGLRQQVEDIRAILFGVEESALKIKLNDFHEEIVPTNSVNDQETKPNTFPFLKIASAAIIVIAIGSVWLFNLATPNEALYTKYFKPDPGLPTTMGASSKDFEFYDAMVNYKQGEYGIAIDKWQIQLDNHPENDTLHYFIGIAHLANNDLSESITYLARAASRDDSVFNSEALYYLGLAYLKENKTELAKENLSLSSVKESKALLSELSD